MFNDHNKGSNVGVWLCGYLIKIWPSVTICDYLCGYLRIVGHRDEICVEFWMGCGYFLTTLWPHSITNSTQSDPGKPGWPPFGIFPHTLLPTDFNGFQRILFGYSSHDWLILVNNRIIKRGGTAVSRLSHSVVTRLQPVIDVGE